MKNVFFTDSYSSHTPVSVSPLAMSLMMITYGRGDICKASALAKLLQAVIIIEPYALSPRAK